MYFIVKKKDFNIQLILFHQLISWSPYGDVGLIFGLGGIYAYFNKYAMKPTSIIITTIKTTSKIRWDRLP